MRILVAESAGFSPAAEARLRELGHVTMADLDQAALLGGVGSADVLVVRLRNRVNLDVLAAAPFLRAVVSPTTGLDHLDLAALDARGIAVLSLRGEAEFLRGVTATAEHAWALLLALVRRVPAAAEAARRGAWDRDRFRGRELAGKTLGVVGLGRLGTMVARYGAAFGMRVVAYDPFVDPGAIPERMPSLAALLAVSDVVSLHVPLHAGTRGMLDAQALAHIKPGAVLVNTSRGDVVDEDALVEAVRSGRLAGAALDVVVGEMGAAGPGASPAVRFAAGDDRILVTPHIGGATLESMENTEIFMAEKLARWLRGEPVRVDAGPAAAPLHPPPHSAQPAPSDAP
ncbi:MAG TPA: NAD(P)-dependent oxidoreductase [Longimicrobiales bacterium]|nr:NAD(P)-dependent oxidoreductase [Longimicrobiales bacterium]